MPDGHTSGDHGRHSTTRSLRSRLSKLSADQWFWEVLGITVSAAAIVAICAILAFFDGKATPKLPRGITVRLYLFLESFHSLWCVGGIKSDATNEAHGRISKASFWLSWLANLQGQFSDSSGWSSSRMRPRVLLADTGRLPRHELTRVTNGTALSPFLAYNSSISSL